jgi:hypothetical protein
MDLTVVDALVDAVSLLGRPVDDVGAHALGARLAGSATASSSPAVAAIRPPLVRADAPPLGSG